MKQELKNSFKNHVLSYVTDFIKEGMNQRKIDHIVDTMTQVKKRIDSLSDSVAISKKVFATAFDGVKTGVMDIDTAMAAYSGTKKIDSDLESLTFVWEVLTDIKNIAETKPSEDIGSQLKNIMLKLAEEIKE